MRARALIIFAISSILPLLLFLYLLDRYDLVASWEAQLLIGLALGVALVGFLVFRQVVSQICALADRFSRLERGESVEPAAEAGPQEISEIARILDAFNRVLAELKANTRELENLIFKLSTLSELTEIASRIPDIQQVLQIVLQRTMGTVNATIGSIMLLEEDGETLRVTAAQGLDEALVGQATTRIGEGISGKVLQEGVPVLVDDVARDPRFAKENNPRYENGSFICMPLQVKDRKIGVINLAKKGNLSSFSEMDLKFLTTLLNHIGFAVENARLLKEAREAARKLQKAVHQKTSELTQAQQQILQSEKLSALGELVAGVAHEINNPLAVVIGYSQLLMGTQTEEKARRNLSKIAEEAQRASRIVQNLLSFARKHAPEKRVWDLHEILQKVLELKAYDLRMSNIEVVTAFGSDVPSTMVDGPQLQQVFLNLVNNGHQAIVASGRPGTLTIQTEADGEVIRIRIRDTGPGIAPEHLERIFDPFFTTKPAGQGTGLGLSISYGIVKGHEGQIYAESEPGQGATFVVELPILDEQTLMPVAEPKGGPQAPSLRRLLVIDDEANINSLLTDMLEAEGYQVDSALQSELALRKLSEQDYDLILCDMRMPGMDARELYHRVAGVKPHLLPRFIFTTGDLLSAETRAFLRETGGAALAKPFAREELIRVLQAAARVAA